MTTKSIKKLGAIALSVATTTWLTGAAFVAPVALAQSTDLQAQINALLAQIQVLQAQLAASQGTPSTAASCSFTRNLTVGSTGDDVKCLQQYLNGAGHQVSATGAGSPGSESTYFGSLTRAAVAKWQAANAVAPDVGYFGPISKAKYTSLLAVAPTIPTDSTTPAPPTTTATTTTPTSEDIIEEIVMEEIVVEETIVEEVVDEETISACQTRKIPADYATIQAAIDAACPGDTILVAPGSYRENIVIRIDNLTIKSEAGAERTTITADQKSVVVLDDGIASLTLDGFTVIGNFDDAAILLNSSGRTVSWIIQNNVIKNSATGLSFRADAGTVVVKRNLIVASKYIGILDNLLSGEAVIENNTIVRGDAAYHLSSAGANHTLKNNIFAEFEKNGVELSSLSTDREDQILSVSYNDVWSVRSGSQGYFSNRKNAAFTPSGTGNLATDPYFVSGEDQHLRAGSLAIDSGDPLSPLDSDGSRADMGAYPFAPVALE